MRWPLSRLGVAVGINVLVFLLLSAAGILLTVSSQAPTVAVDAFFFEPDAAEARIITRVISPEIVPTARLRDNRVRVTGIIQCTAGQTLLLRVTVTQGDTVARGTAEEECTGHPQRWVVDATTGGDSTLQSGSASVHVWSSTVEDGDEHVWDSEVRLTGKQ